MTAGFRYATEAELTAMLKHGGLMPLNIADSPHPWDLVSYNADGPALAVMLGTSSPPGSTSTSVWGLTAPFIRTFPCWDLPEFCEPPQTLACYTYLIARDLGPGKVTAATFESSGPISTSRHESSSMGSWLVRETSAYVAP